MLDQDLSSIGWSCYHAHRIPEAIAAFTAVSNSIGNGSTLQEALAERALSLCYSEIGQWDHSLEHGRRAVHLVPNNPEISLRFAQSLIDAKRVFEARDYLSEAVGRFHDCAMHAEVAAMLEFFAGNPLQGAILVTEAVARGMPSRPHVINEATTVYCLAGRLPEAEGLIEQYPCKNHTLAQAMIAETRVI